MDEESYTLEELLVGIQRVINYIGKDKFKQLIKDNKSLKNDSAKKTPDDYLHEINNY